MEYSTCWLLPPTDNYSGLQHSIYVSHQIFVLLHILTPTIWSWFQFRSTRVQSTSNISMHNVPTSFCFYCLRHQANPTLYFLLWYFRKPTVRPVLLCWSVVILIRLGACFRVPFSSNIRFSSATVLSRTIYPCIFYGVTSSNGFIFVQNISFPYISE